MDIERIPSKDDRAKWKKILLPGGNYTYLFAILMAYFFILPLIRNILPRFGLVIDIYMLVIFLSAFHAIFPRRRLFLMAMVLLCMGFAFLFAADYSHSLQLRAIGCILVIAMSIMVIYHMVEDVLTTDKVSFNMISGALCGYLLVAMTWGLIYQVVEIVWPDSFLVGKGLTLLPDFNDPTNNDWTTFNYFSFVTITTLGYGNISPVSIQARSLTVMEAVLGQIYLVVLVAKLVGQHVSQSKTNHVVGEGRQE